MVQRGPDGSITPDPVRFPSGIKALADYVHARGLKFGIYSSASTSQCCSKFYKDANDGKTLLFHPDMCETASRLS